MAGRPEILKKTARLYIGKSTVFKLLLLAGVAVISAVFVWYTFTVINRLQEDTRSQVDKYVKMWQMAANSPTSGTELQFIFDEIIVKASFPIVVLDPQHRPIHWRNIKGVQAGDTTTATFEKLTKISQQMISDHGEYPLYFGDNLINYFCYGDSDVINQLKIMPFIEIGILAAFLLLAFIGFQSVRQSEERHIWVGMAKETAHQLGTPISSLMGWMEVIKSEHEGSPPPDGNMKIDIEIFDNMIADVERLQRVANRFGSIGSVPEVRSTDVNRLIADSVVYYKRRLPFEGEGVQLTFEAGDIPPAYLNAELFGWALENLIRNALQAVDQKTGRVTLRSSLDAGPKWIQMEIIDNGPGINPAVARRIFRAGFTTKKRGWGLGLTLVKRIIEEYHGGRIYLRKSRPGDTVFVLLLPLNEDKKG